MPFGPLLRRLEKCRGRVIRADRAGGALEAGGKPDRLTESEWRAFCDRLSDADDGLFVEYRIPHAGRTAAH